MSESTVGAFDPNISRLKRLAKSLKKDVESRDPQAVGRVTSAGGDPSLPFGLRKAQFVIAREHGFEGWHQLIEEAGDRLVDERDIHRWFGVELNNASWRFLDAGEDVSSWPRHKVEEALYRAYATVYHWMQVGTPIHHGRGEHLIARTALVTGRLELALHHAERYQQIIDGHPELAEDWDRAFALEAHARALAAAGRLGDARQMKTQAEEACASVTNPEDRAIVLAELGREPWFGI